MRLAIDLFVGINALAGIVGFMVRHRRKRSLAHDEYQQRLEQENRDIDEERERLGLG